jgi:hypothetical protein
MERHFEFCDNPRQLSGWAPDMPLTIRTATYAKSLRVVATQDNIRVEMNLYRKGEGKAQIVVQHSKLPDAGQAAHRKVYWTAALQRLSELMAGQ